MVDLAFISVVDTQSFGQRRDVFGVAPRVQQMEVPHLINAVAWRQHGGVDVTVQDLGPFETLFVVNSVHRKRGKQATLYKNAIAPSVPGSAGIRAPAWQLAGGSCPRLGSPLCFESQASERAHGVLAHPQRTPELR